MSAVRSVLLALAVLPALLQAQVPTKCLEIESILVDACNPSDLCPGSSEGQNEMVRFRTGPQATPIGALEADWPNNTWRGLVQNGTTAQLTAALNATITTCGLLLEPPAGIIPPGSQVLMVTSTEMCVAANPFTNLVDTLYIVYQLAGNTQGHFANNPASGQPITLEPSPDVSTRTLILFYTPTNCSDTATYVREQLVNNEGTYGGPGVINDGATAQFTWPGVPQVSYVNYGCQAPIEPLVVEAEALGSLCGGSPVSLEGTVSGTYASVLWQGGQGTFSDPNAISTQYTPGPDETGDVELQFCATTACGTLLCTTLVLPTGEGPVVSVNGGTPLVLCEGNTLDLVADGADSYLWSTGATTATLTIVEAGSYTVTGTNACGTASTTVEVVSAQGPEVSISGDDSICPGESSVLTAVGADSYVWNTGAVGPTLTVTAGGTYTVTGNNGCGSEQSAFVVTLSPGPQVAIQGDDTFCQGGSTVLTATGADTFLWSTGATTPDIEITVAGTYTVAGTNACGTVEAEVIVVIGNAPTVSITGDLLICPGQGTVLSATGSTGAVWSTGEQGSSITASTAGVYSVSVSNACGTATDEVEVAVTEVQAGATADVTSGVAPLSVSFQHTGTTGAEIDWQFGDGATDSGTDPVHVFDDPGVYTVTQEVTVDGCTATATFIITVLELEGPPSSVIVPNVITPNGDGQNDFFQLISEGLAQVELTIFNRWGQVVARIEAPGLTWDAQTTAGDRVADGTYFYTLKAKGRDGVDHEGSGHITVLR